MKHALGTAALAAALLVVIALYVLREPAREAASAATPVEAADSAASEAAAPADLLAASPAEPAPSSAREAAPAQETPPALEQPDAAATEALARIDVIVLSRDTGQPAPGARVTAFRAGQSLNWLGRPGLGPQALPGESARTSESGAATLFVDPDVAHVVVALDHFEQRADVDALARGASAQAVLHIPTEADVTVFGRVVSAHDGRAVSGARARIDTNIEEATTSDLHGRFVLRARRWRDKTLHVRAGDYIAFSIPLEHVRSSEAAPFEVTLHAYAELEVSVLDSRGAPLAASLAVRVARSPEHESARAEHDGKSRWLTVASPSGEARLRRLPAGVPLELELRTETRRWKHAELIELDPSRPTRVEARYPGGARVLGRVHVPPDTPKRAWTIELVELTEGDPDFASARQHTSTDADGRFAFDEVPVGRWMVRLGPFQSIDGNNPASAEPLVLEVNEALSDRVVELTIVSAGFVRGSVLDAQGLAVATFVEARGADGTRLALTRSDARGEFALGPLPAQRTVQVVARGRGHVGSDSPPLETLGASAVVRLQLAPGGAARVRNLGLAMRAVERIEIVHFDSGRSWSKANPDEEHLFDGLPVGRYTLRVIEAKAATGEPIAFAVTGGSTIEVDASR